MIKNLRDAISISLAAAVVIWLYWSSGSHPGSKAQQDTPVYAAKQNRDTIEAEARRLARSGEFWRAHLVAAEGAVNLDDAALRDLSREMELADHHNTLGKHDSQQHQRMWAIQRLREMDPEAAIRYTSDYGSLLARESQKVREAELREIARKRTQGVSVGMSQEDVLASSWGKPESINVTVGRYGRHEQWVYRIGSYLYFDDGRLTSIQTTRK